jgi:putative ABC transport system permease protein
LVGASLTVEMRRRRHQLAVLKALGWPRWRIVLLVQLELALLATAVGTLGLVVLVALSGLGQSITHAALGIAIGLTAVLIGGTLPALIAARGATAKLMQIQARRPSAPIRSVAFLALRDAVVQRPLATGLACLCGGLGSGICGSVLLIVIAFRDQLGPTTLGQHLDAQVRLFDVVIAGASLIAGSLAAGQVVSLSFLDRRAELATLRALGWPRSAVARLVAVQAALVGLAGIVVGATAVIVLAWSVNASSGDIAVTILATATAGAVTGALAATTTLRQAISLPPALAIVEDT